MNLKFEFENERKKHLGLTEFNTKKIYDIVISDYKKRLIKAPRKTIGFSIDLVLCNMNGYNKLGKLEELNKNWGDNNFYVDLNNSGLIELEINEEGNIESGFTDLPFKEIKEFKDIESISLSIKEIIELCQKDNFRIKLFAKGGYDDATTIEIEPYMSFEMDDNLKKYLDSLK